MYVNIKEFGEMCNLTPKTMILYKCKKKLPPPDLTRCDCCDEKIERWSVDTVLDYKHARHKHISFRNVSIDEVRRMTNEKMTRKEMAKKLKVPIQTIYRACRHYKIKSVINKANRINEKPQSKTDLFNAFLAAQIR